MAAAACGCCLKYPLKENLIVSFVWPNVENLLLLKVWVSENLNIETWKSTEFGDDFLVNLKPFKLPTVQYYAQTLLMPVCQLSFVSELIFSFISGAGDRWSAVPEHWFLMLGIFPWKPLLSPFSFSTLMFSLSLWAQWQFMGSQPSIIIHEKIDRYANTPKKTLSQNSSVSSKIARMHFFKCASWEPIKKCVYDDVWHVHFQHFRLMWVVIRDSHKELLTSKDLVLWRH